MKAPTPRWLAGFLLTLATASAATLSDAQQQWLARAHRLERHGWIYLHVEGSPRALGFQHGYLLAPEIAEELRVRKVSWEYTSATEWSWLASKAGELTEGKIDADLLEELDGMAEGMQAAGFSASRAELIAYNAFFELAWYWWPNAKKAGVKPPVRESCSAFIATGRMTRDGGIVLAHNSMVDYPEATANVILDLAPDRGHRILMQIWPGWIHSGTDFFVTDAGLVGAETTIGGFGGYEEGGIPEFVRMRRATQSAASIDAWCDIMRQGNNGGYANAWLIGDVNSAEIARLELGLKHVRLERTRDGYFVGSNVAEDLKILRFETEANELDVRVSSVARRVRWKHLMAQNAGQIDLEHAQRFEADHFDSYLGKRNPGPRSLCGHFELDPVSWGAWPGAPFYPAGTFDGKVVDTRLARQMSLAARWGSACGRPFDAPKFLKAHPQFDWMKDILRSRRSHPWTVFRAGE